MDNHGKEKILQQNQDRVRRFRENIKNKEGGCVECQGYLGYLEEKI